MNEALLEAISIAGSQAALAKHLKLRQQAVAKWVLKGRVPPFRAIQIEEFTKGVVAKSRLRPDLFTESSGTPALAETPVIDDQRSLAADGRAAEEVRA